MQIKSRPATQSDLLAYYGKLPPYAVRARVLEDGGAIVGVAGYHVENGYAVVFSDKAGYIPKITIWREALGMMADIKIRALCVAESGSGRFLERLGWVFAGNSSMGEVYQWQP